jgi:phenylacetic acid degradation protein
MPLYEFEGRIPSVHTKAFVHPLAALIGDVEVDEDCYVGAGAVLRGDIGAIRLGTGSNVQENCVVHTYPGESTIIHPGVHVGHGAVLHGCEIHPKVLVGMGSILSDRVKVNSRCIIGAASFVPFGMEIPSDSLVMGSPAKIVRSIVPEQLDQIESGLSLYQELTRRYLKSFREKA